MGRWGDGKEWNAEVLRFKGGTCGSKALHVFCIHVRLRSYQGFNDSKMPMQTRTMQRYTSITAERNRSWKALHKADEMDA
jgi:hypothetical protein